MPSGAAGPFRALWADIKGPIWSDRASGTVTSLSIDVNSLETVFFMSRLNL